MGAIDRVFRGRRPSQERPLAAIIAGLWRNGEQGARYEAGDLSTMFQDAAGTLPVYAPGQGQVDPPVGLWLDKRLGFALGPERITNTGFQTLSGWTAVRGSTATVSGGTVTVTTANPQDWGSVCTPIETEPGKTYIVKVLLTAGNGQNVQLLISESAVNHVNITNTGGSRNATGYYSLVFKATKAVHYVWLGSATNTASVGISTWTMPSAREISANYAYQTTTTSRPTLSARYNWATFTEDLTASVWQKGTPAFTITPKATLAPDGVSLAGIVVSPDSGTPILSHVLTAQAPSVALSFFIKPISNATALSLLFRNNTTATNYDGTTLNTVNGTAGVPAWVVTPAGNGWLKISYARATGITAGDQISIYAGATGAAAVPGRIWSVWGLDVRSGKDGVGLPPYQRVVDANTYDTTGFPLYLNFDGVDDFLQTASIDFSGSDKVFCAASFRKLSDATTGSLFELSATIASNPGSFYITAPGAVNSGNIKLATKGTTEVNVATTAAGYPAPISAIASAVMDIAAPISTLRINGVVAQSSSASLGSGSLGNYPLYIGRRAGSSLPFNGRLYGLLIRGAATTDSTIAKVERYLNQKAKVFR